MHIYTYINRNVTFMLLLHHLCIPMPMIKINYKQTQNLQETPGHCIQHQEVINPNFQNKTLTVTVNLSILMIIEIIILYSMLVSRVLYLANLTNSRKIAKLNPRESY